VRESDARFLERLLDELEPGAGPRLAVVGVDAWDVHDGVRVEVTLSRLGRRWTLSTTRASLIEAAAELRQEVVIARLGDAFREVV
jgi:hypothetical protein